MARILSPRRKRRPRRMEQGANADNNSNAKMQMIEDRLLGSSNISKYFLAFLAMTFIQALGIIVFGLMSTSLHNGSLFGPMEIYMMSNLWITHKHHNHHHHQHQNSNQHSSLIDDDAVDDDVIDDDAVLEVEDNFLNGSDSSTFGAVFDLVAATRNDTTSLDDYYSRPHIVPTLRPEEGPPILIVGGSDGSGTRAFVDTLRSLGVPMLIDDKATLDVHAPVIFSHNQDKTNRGWPPLVQLILNETHSADYNLEDLPESVREAALEELQKFQDFYASRVEALSKSASSSADNKAPKNATLPIASNVQYGFKAPVSMLLIPLLLAKFGRVKFLHVVRDGRDVSFSRNTSPVIKFYNQSYKDPKEKLEKIKANVNATDASTIQAMQLWNDWNSQVWEWSNRNADGKTFDFLVMRTEDMVSPLTRFESLVKLADFVGSSLSTDELCCLSQKAIVDMGQSTGGGGKKRVKRNRHKSGVDERERDFQRKAHLRYRQKDTEDLDDPNDITMQDVAMESERKALDSALRKRPEVFERIQVVREYQQAKVRQRREETLGIGRGRISHGEGNDHQPKHTHRQRRRLSEERERIVESVRRGGLLQKVREKRNKQAPERVLSRYGKWKSVLEGRPDLSSELHKEGTKALEMFGYYPPRRYADFFQGGNKLVCNTICHRPSSVS